MVRARTPSTMTWASVVYRRRVICRSAKLADRVVLTGDGDHADGVDGAVDLD
jgi:hypothetical protein